MFPPSVSVTIIQQKIKEKKATKTTQKYFFLLFYCNFGQHVWKLDSFFSSFLRGAAPVGGLLLSKALMLLCKNWSSCDYLSLKLLWPLASDGWHQRGVCRTAAQRRFSPFLLRLCVKIPSEQHFLWYSEQHRRPRHIQSWFKWTHFAFLRKSLNFSSLAHANVNSLPVTWQHIKTSLPIPEEE